LTFDQAGQRKKLALIEPVSFLNSGCFPRLKNSLEPDEINLEQMDQSVFLRLKVGFKSKRS
jgi:hypothetical protein